MGAVITIIVVVFIIICMGAKIVRPYEKGVVERLGKYCRTCDAGLNIIIPILEHMIKVDMREQVVDVPPQQVITQDNVAVEVDAVVYYTITDPKNVLYNIANFYVAITKLAQTSLRNLIGDMSLDSTLTSRDEINGKLREILDVATDKWGVRVNRVELQRIEPPLDVTEAMHRQMKAERDRRAVILEAEGQKQSAILKSEGQKQAQILNAQGEAEALKQVADAKKYQTIALAEGEGEAIAKVFSAIHKGQATDDVLAIKYMEALAKIADGKSTKIFLPLEGSNFMGSIAGIAELFKDKNKEN
ncbi:MAG: SPFH/Band 7/PHB domain protein [Armatimonadetes bacterium]|nr:SPFH/Band 7/PHB domain protein [Candidatus Hippobium faecium]